MVKNIRECIFSSLKKGDTSHSFIGKLRTSLPKSYMTPANQHRQVFPLPECWLKSQGWYLVSSSLKNANNNTSQGNLLKRP